MAEHGARWLERRGKRREAARMRLPGLRLPGEIVTCPPRPDASMWRGRERDEHVRGHRRLHGATLTNLHLI